MADNTPSARQLDNERILKIYAAILCGLLAVFILKKWISIYLIKKHRIALSACQHSNQPFFSCVRTLRKFALKSSCGFPSRGHAVLVGIYVIVNVVLTFVNLDYSKVNYYGVRFGWMAFGNLAFIVFLALKNTPLAFLTGHSYERLNYFHRVAGYTTIVHVLLHAATFIDYDIGRGKPEKLIAFDNLMGVIAGCAMFIILISALFIMRPMYELFYVIHIVLFIVIIVTTGLHRPDWIDRVPIVMILCGAVWVIDRLIRFTRIVVHSINNKAHLEVLPNGGTKIVLKKPLKNAAPGSHCFLWVPRVSPFESHPFTIVSNGPAGLELVARAHDGFTKSLYEFARDKSNPSGLIASVDGPYGTCPDLTTYDKVFLLVGGSGATFAFGLALEALQRSNPNQLIHMIWAVKKPENVSWFRHHLATCCAHASRFSLSLYVTEGQDPGIFSGEPQEALEKSPQTSIWGIMHSSDQDENFDISGDKSDSVESQTGMNAVFRQQVPESWTVKYQKLDILNAVSALMGSTPHDQRVIVAACGPSGMIETSRNTISQLLRSDGPEIDFHCESFNW